jgi:hypothetical protein
VSGIDDSDDAPGTGVAGAGTVGRKGEPKAGGLASERTELSLVAPGEFAGPDGSAALDLPVDPGR